MGKTRKSDELRNAVEEMLKKRNLGEPLLSEKGPLALVHELQVHQIELEMQNDELVLSRKKAEEAQRRYQELYDFAPIGYLVLDKKMKIVSANLAAGHLLGEERGLLVGRPMVEFIMTEFVRRFTLFSAKVLAGEREERCELKLRRKGSEGAWVLISGAKVGEHIDSMGYLLVSLTDIIEKKKAEEIIRLSEEKFSKIFHAAPCLISITTLEEGRFIDVNENCITTLGYWPDEIIGRTSVELGIWEDPSDRARVEQVMVRDGTVRDLEVRFRSKGGKHLTCLFSAEMIEIDGKAYILAIVSDITDRVKAAEKIIRLNRELEAFNYAVAHDLNNHLNTIGSYCQLQMQLCDNGNGIDCLGYANKAYNCVLRMKSFIKAMLEFSHLTHREVKRKDFDLSQLALEIARGYKFMNKSRRVDLHIAEGIQVNGDPALLRVVLNNLIENAFKYTGKKEEAVIELGATEKDGERVYFVRDNGAGFDMAQADKLFILFNRLPGLVEFKGDGIGLAICERIIQRHGGEIWAKAKPGEGATFFFTL